MASDLQEWQEKEFNELLKAKNDALILFSAPWCAACKTLTPQIDELAKKRNNIIFAKIDVSKNPGLASKMGVMSLPNILFIKNGKVGNQIIGATSLKNIEDKLKIIK